MFEDSLAPRTQYDLHFHVGDIPVRVHPYFWLGTLLLGLGNLNRPVPEILRHLALWAAVVFVSILVHELGHVLMGRAFGARGHILLYSFGGLAIGSSGQRERWQRICVLLAGPGAGFLLAGTVAGLLWLYDPELALDLLGALIRIPMNFRPSDPPDWVLDLLYELLFVNILWGLINLLPIWPLDGGQICREICEAAHRRDGMKLSAQISMFTAGALAVMALVEMAAKKPIIPFLPLGGLFSVILFGVLAYNSYQLYVFLQRAGPGWREEWHDEPREPWEQDADWWKK